MSGDALGGAWGGTLALGGSAVGEWAARDWALLGVVALPLVVALLLPLASAVGVLSRRSWIPAFVVALIDLVAIVWLRATESNSPAEIRLPWMDALGVELAFRLDGLAFLFALMVSGIGLGIVGFSARYIPHDLEVHRIHRKESTFYACLLFFMGTMLGLVCADDAMTLYLFWEGTSISSFLLIAFDLLRQRTHFAATKAFSITAGAGLGLFVALVALTTSTESTSLSAIRDSPELVREFLDGPFVALVVGGILLAAVAKSAQVPLHVWLPDAMVAPTPVSAYLHSATMVAAGVFLLARFAPVLGPVPEFGFLLALVGAVTLVFGAAVALVQTKLKAILAFSTISQYGYVTLLLGLGAYGAALFVILAHALLKAGLFLCTGLVSHATGRGDVRELGGLWRRLPITAVVTAILALGLAGAPLVSGFWMKEVFYKEVLAANSGRLTTASLAGGILTFTYMVRFWWRIFLSPRCLPQSAHVESERTLTPMLVPVAALALLSLSGGVWPGLFTSLSDAGLESVAPQASGTTIELHWPPDATLLLTIITFALGFLLVAWMAKRDRLLEFSAPPPSERPPPHESEEQRTPARLGAAVLRRAGISTLYDRGIVALDGLSRFVAKVQTGVLLHYVLALAAVPIALGVVLLPQVKAWPMSVERTIAEAEWAFGALAVAAVSLALASTLVRSQIASVLMVGGVGYVLAVAFAILHAPDVAVVQVIVETVFAAFMLLAIGRLRDSIRKEAMGPRGRRSHAARASMVLVATALGAVFTVTTLAVAGSGGDDMLGNAFLDLTDDVGARDVVATILVDFRMLDTFGEITVFAVAALGSGLLLGQRQHRKQSRRKSDDERKGDVEAESSSPDSEDDGDNVESGDRPHA